MPSELDQLGRDPDIDAAVLRARQAAITGPCKETVMAVGGGARMIVTVPHDHIVAVVVRMVRMVIVVSRIWMIVGLAVVVLRPHGPRRDESDRQNGRRC
jgi:hypothetical protein